MNDEATIVDTYTKENDDAAIEIAQRLWAKLYDSSRSTSSRGKRIDNGVPNKRKSDSLSEAAWVKRRRSEVDELVSRRASSSTGSTSVNNKAIMLAEQTWYEEHCKEERFQIEKQRRRLLDGLARGLLLPDEIEPHLRDELLQELEKDVAKDKKYDAEQTRKVAALAVLPRPSIVGMWIFIDKSVDVPFATLRTWCRSSKTHRTRKREEATIYCVSDLSKVGQRNRWCAILRGGIICTPEFFATCGARGTAIAYKAALGTRRWIWFSDAFASLRPSMHQQIKDAADAYPGCKWKFVASKKKALALAAKKNAAEVLMIVLRKEQRQDPELSHVFYKLTLEDAQVFLETIDRSRSARGIGVL